MSATPIIFGSPEAQRYVRIARDPDKWQSLRLQLAEAQREADYWRKEAGRLEEEIRKLEKGVSENV